MWSTACLLSPWSFSCSFSCLASTLSSSGSFATRFLSQVFMIGYPADLEWHESGEVGLAFTTDYIDLRAFSWTAWDRGTLEEKGNIWKFKNLAFYAMYKSRSNFSLKYLKPPQLSNFGDIPESACIGTVE
ncbi:hypothetical protein R1flu_003616 [Riccia fluitans]|uniref:Secreted protein n=1 Tax=Riccia fluitans TaxID=41844 RepID=A0ABD1Y9K6_9MARC